MRARMTRRKCHHCQTLNFLAGATMNSSESKRVDSFSESALKLALRDAMPEEWCEARWYAAYTSANHEKRVAEQLVQRSVEYFLPVYESVRCWKDRRVKLDMPLFPGYVFVRIALRDRLCVQQVPGIARLVGFGNMPTALPEDEMQALRASLRRGVRAQPHPFLTVGQRVRVKNGPMVGLQGVLKRRKSQARLVVSLELIQRAIAVEVDEADLEPMA
jgi:transcription antitermination factor NusG